MIKRYNMRKIKWYAILLINVPYPRFAFDEEEAEYMEERRKKAEIWESYSRYLFSGGLIYPYRVGFNLNSIL